MTLHDISLIGWVHSVACIVAMVCGTLQIFRRKGTPSHAQSGTVYFFSMVIMCITALFIYRVDVVFRGNGPELGPFFGIFHWLAVITLMLLLVARYAASNQRRAFFAYLHPICMILTYWFLMGGAINQVFERVDWARAAALAMSPEARSVTQFKLLFIAQFALDIVILVMMVTALVQVRRNRRKLRAGTRVSNVPDSPALSRSE